MERARRSPGIFSFFAAALAMATLLPLVATMTLWRFVYQGNATRSLGLAQIRSALDGFAALLDTEPFTAPIIENREALARAKRLLNGPIRSLRVGASSEAKARAALRAFGGTAGLDCVGDSILDPEGRVVGARNADGTWSLLDPPWVARAGALWDAASEEERRRLANAPVYLRAERDISRSVIRVGQAGYVWAITAAPVPDQAAYELFHPEIEAVDVGALANAAGERVGAEIARLRGFLGTARESETVRYDYAWKNPGDSRERKKIVLLRYLADQGMVLCAGLYEDEYFLPAQTAQYLFILMVLAIGAISVSLSLGIILRINRSLRDLTLFSESTATTGAKSREPLRSGIREIDVLARTMVEMEGQILSRQGALEREVEEKNALLREVHHRVKNNLSVLASMVSLQMERTDSAAAREALERMEGRVASMAMAYQQLVDSGEYARIPFDEYLRSLLSYYQSSVAPGRPTVARRESLEPCAIGLEAAVPLGIVAQELVANAYAHGRPAGPSAGRAPEISVSLAREGGRVVLEVADNGEGLAADSEERTGLLLVRALAAQLGAVFSLESPSPPLGGTRARFSLDPGGSP